MTTDTKRLVTGGIIGLIAAVFLIFPSVLRPQNNKKTSPAQPLPPRIKSAGEDSPIIIAGGSMTVHSTNIWKPTPPGETSGVRITSSKTTAPSPIGYVNFQRVYDYPINGNPTTATPIPGLTGWQIELHVRDATTGKYDPSMASTNDGFTISSDSACNAQNANCDVTITPLGSKSKFKDPLRTLNNAGEATKFSRFRYSNFLGRGCKLGAGEFCEHIGYIKLYYKTSTSAPNWTIKEYFCHRGECRIEFSDPP